MDSNHDTAATYSAGEARTIPGGARKAQVIGLADNLDRTDRHPVLIFGASQAGKTAMILSLILGLQTMPDIDIYLGEPVFDPGNDRSEPMHLQAKETYERLSYVLAGGGGMKTTQTGPFFIPVDIIPRNSLMDPVKLAFLDGRGEDYQPQEQETVDLYKALAPDIIDVLANYPRAVTVIYVAPYSISGGHDRDTLGANFGLMGAIQAYRQIRPSVEDDFHLFLLTKWDQHASPMDPRAPFADASAEDVDKILNDRYPHAWGVFQGLRLGGPARERRTFMQYASGYYPGGVYTPPPSSLRDVFNQYPRTVMNWLYGNASQVKFRGREAILPPRRPLFPDVVFTPPRRSVIDILAHILTSR